MKFHHQLATAVRTLRTNAVRSGLTILGIVIGITAIILVVAVGRGAEELILDQVRQFGPETIIVESGREPRGPSDFIEFFSDSLKIRDVDALMDPANVQGVAEVTPLLVDVGTAQFGGETYRAHLRGSAPTAFNILKLEMASGVFFPDDDVRRRANTAVIGANVSEELFGNARAVGEVIRVKGHAFRVVGVLAEEGSGNFIPIDDIVFMPHTTVRERILHQDHYNVIIVRAESETIVDRVKRDIEATLRERHGITDPSKDDFHVMTMQDAVDQIGIIATALTALLVAMASIALVVGGIGIMNIMLVAVAERTREIGLRKALGATRRDILGQFLLESVALTMVGGIIGILCGAALAYVASFVLQATVASAWSFTFPMSAAVLGVGVAAVVGLIFGLYPAAQAARKSPIEALRHE